MLEIMWLSGPDRGETIGLQIGENVVGRSRRADITLRDRSLSMFHCRIYVNEADAAEIEDAKSLNGTYVNGHRVQAIRIDLPVGCEVAVGAASFCLRQAEGQAPVARQERQGRRLSYRERRIQSEESSADGIALAGDPNDRTQVLDNRQFQAAPDAAERRQESGRRRRSRRSEYREVPRLDDEPHLPPPPEPVPAGSAAPPPAPLDLESELRSQKRLAEQLQNENLKLREKIATLEQQARNQPPPPAAAFVPPASPFGDPLGPVHDDAKPDDLKGFWSQVTVEKASAESPAINSEDLLSQIDQLDGDLVSHTYAIAALEAEIEILNDEIDTLEAELEESDARYAELEQSLQPGQGAPTPAATPVAEQQRQLIDELIDDLGS